MPVDLKARNALPETHVEEADQETSLWLVVVALGLAALVLFASMVREPESRSFVDEIGPTFRHVGANLTPPSRPDAPADMMR